MNRLPVIFLLSFVLVACAKKDNTPCPEVNVVAPASEVANLRAYIQANNINANEDPRGFFFRIDVTGTGPKPTACSSVIVNYVGTLASNGSQFDSGTNVSFSLSRLISGWQEGIPLVGAGGTIVLYLPPSLAYGSGATGGIPPNSNLIFKIDLKSVI